MDKINVVLADDQTIVRKGLRALLERVKDINVLGEAINGNEAVELAETLQPDVIVMDIGMPELNGIEATKRLVKMKIPVKIIILTVHSNEEYVYQIFNAGAQGYLIKDSAPDELTLAIRAVTRGEKYLSPKLSSIIVDQYVNPSVREYDPFHDLTEREVEVLQLIGEGHSFQEIAKKLFISDRTVEVHRRKIGEKLNLHSKADIIHYAIKRGISTLK